MESKIFDGFEEISKALNKPLGDDALTHVGGAADNIPVVDPEDLKKQVDDDAKKVAAIATAEPDDTGGAAGTGDSGTGDGAGDGSGDDLGGTGDPIDDSGDGGGTQKPADEELDLEEFEPDISSFIQDKLAEKMNWEFKEEDKFESIDDVLKYMQSVIDTNSQPEYANDEVKKYDDFVREGGNLRDFYKDVYENRLKSDDVDLENEEDQRRIIRENLVNKGYKAERITKLIERYDESGILKDEAEDGLEMIKEYNEKNSKKLLDDQKNYADDMKKQQLKFVQDVQDKVKGLDNICGDKISEVEKKSLLEYIFKFDSNNTSNYQREYSKDPIISLLEAAYYKKNRQAMVNRIQKQADSNAYKNLKKKLKDGKVKRTKGATSQTQDDISLGLLGSQILFRQPE